MKRAFVILAISITTAAFSSPVFATNGDNLIGVGPISRAMGGVGVAAPQDAISAVFANPAAMCFGPYCPNSQTVFGATIFVPTVKATVNGTGFGGALARESSKMEPFIIPAVGITSPIGDRLRFGFGAFGVSGLGVDYRNSDFDLGGGPGSGDMYTMFQVMKFAPNLAYQVNPNFSIGGNVQIVYGALDLQKGTSHNYTMGVQAGGIYRLGTTSIGFSYATGQKVDHDRVMDFTGDGTLDTLELESPENYAFGVAFKPASGLLVEADIKVYNWADSDGYSLFDWENQTVYAIGAQYALPSGWTVRAGYNYGKSPVKVHDQFDDTSMQVFGQEYLRVIGFPAIVETHYTLGAGYEFSGKFALNLGYMKGVKNSIEETGATLGTNLKSELEEDSYDFSMNWNF
jgi:long-chain fatty acid transport protein